MNAFGRFVLIFGFLAIFLAVGAACEPESNLSSEAPNSNFTEAAGQMSNTPSNGSNNRSEVIPSNQGVIAEPNSGGQIDPCNCHGYDGIGGPCYDGIGGPAYAGIGGPCYSGIGGTGKDCPKVCKRK